MLILNFNFIRNKTEFNHISKIIHRAARENSVTKTRNLYLNWKMYCETVLDSDIFGAKVDVIDAFGNVNISMIVKFIFATILTLYF